MPSSCEAKLGRLVAASAATLVRGEALAEAPNACASDARPRATTKGTFMRRTFAKIKGVLYPYKDAPDRRVGREKLMRKPSANNEAEDPKPNPRAP